MTTHTQTHCILDFGADPTGRVSSTGAIQAALDAVDGRTPSRIRIPRGHYTTALLQPRSNTELHLETGAVLKASTRYEDFQFEGKIGGILLARNLENISITGTGTIDGSEYNWFAMDRSRGFIDYDVSTITQGASFVDFPNPFPDGPVEPHRRPGNLLIFSNCRNVRLSGPTIKGAPFWTIHMADCVDILAENMTINHDQRIPNNDGIHLSSCRHALLRNLDIRSGDDAIALTGFRDLKGEPEIELGFQNLDGELKDIRVENCRLSSRSSAIRIGYGSNELSDLHFKNVTITDSNRGVLIQVRDAGSIRGLTFEDMTVDTRYMAGSWWGNGEPVSISVIKRKNRPDLGRIDSIVFRRVSMTAPSPVTLYAAERGWIQNVTFSDCELRLKEDPLQAQRGCIVDLRPVADFQHALFNIPPVALYSQHVDHLNLEGARFLDVHGNEHRHIE